MSVDEGSFVGREEEGAIADILRPSDSSDGDSGSDELLIEARSGGHPFDLDISGGDAVDADAIGSDFESEFQMALANRKLNPDLDTAFLMTNAEYMYLSSSIVKDIAAHGGDISGFVSPELVDEVLKRMRKED